MTTVGRWNAKKVRNRVLNNTWAIEDDLVASNGMVLIVPTSITSTGTGNSSSIGVNGSVTFSTCATLSLNGVFTSAYDNYMISMRSKLSATTSFICGRLRASGTDATATTDYNTQSIFADGTAYGGSRQTNEGYWRLAYSDTTYNEGYQTVLFGPKLSQPTVHRTFGVVSIGGASIYDHAGTHELSTSYDGITFLSSNTNTFSGLVAVYGLVGA